MPQLKVTPHQGRALDVYCATGSIKGVCAALNQPRATVQMIFYRTRLANGIENTVLMALAWDRQQRNPLP